MQVRGDGPPLLLLPGQANNHHWWDLVRDDFAPHHMTVTFDYQDISAARKNANFAVAEPPLKLVLLQNPGQGGHHQPSWR